MKYKNLESVISILKKIKLPSLPQKRMVIFKTLSELESKLTVYNSVKQTYETEELVNLEKDKYAFVKKYASESGIEIFGIKISKKDMPIVMEYITKKNQELVYQEYVKFVEFSDTDIIDIPSIKIDDLPDDVFDNLETPEIEILSEIIS